MSYDLHLLDPHTKEPLEAEEPHQLRGGTYEVGGPAALHLNVSNNYWEPTEGNVKVALLQLLELAKMRPDGIWDGD